MGHPLIHKYPVFSFFFLFEEGQQQKPVLLVTMHYLEISEVKQPIK
jgi:hypothetical protein